MNKNIKRTIALALILGGVSAVSPVNYSIFTTEAKASISDGYKLTDLNLTTSNGTSLDLYKDSDYSNKLSGDLEVDKIYYAMTTSSSVRIDSIDGADKNNVRIFKEGSNVAYKVDDNIKIFQGASTILKVRVYKNAYDKYQDYSTSDYNEYIIEVENTKNEENKVYLSNITLNDESIQFNKMEASYKINVPLNTDSINVQAVPENEAYTVKINGTTVNKDDNYKKTITLNEKSTNIQIAVSDVNGNTKMYILKVVRTDETQDNEKGKNGWKDKNVFGDKGLHKGWFKENGAWRYLDNEGKAKKGWLKDTDESWYYLDNDGKMKTSWLKDADGSWYFLDNNGKMKTSWFKDEDGSWYYLNSNGKMITGWFKDADGNWYYFHASGKMAKNTSIDGYSLNGSGAWVK
jgi:FOG: Glucan-binding domain (YG repeat)